MTGSVPFPKTAHSISRPTIVSSTRILRSWCAASFKPAISSSRSDALLTPLEEPALDGLINTGYANRFSMRATTSSIFSSSLRMTSSYAAWRTPVWSTICFVYTLSIETLDASTPHPTYGIFASSKMPWMVPSSPQSPCRTGNTTSMRIISALPSFRTITDFSVASGERIAVVVFFLQLSSSICSTESTSSHFPSSVMPIRVTS